MAFSLGNFNIDEIIYGVATNFDGELLYSLDQLSSAQIEVSSDSTDITDKRGNIVRTIYKTKNATFTATNAFLHPQVLNAQSGSEVEIATETNTIIMPKIEVIAAGTVQKKYKLSNPVDSSVKVIGIYANGGNSAALKPSTTASGIDLTYIYSAAEDEITLPELAENAPVSYLIKYDRTVTSGMKLSNDADSFADTIRLTLYCSMVDPCEDALRACYVYIPSFQPSPDVTISLDAENQEIDFTGNLQVDYCSAEKNLYVIYFPDEDAVTTAIVG